MASGGQFLVCPSGSEQLSSHVVLVWVDDGAAYAVSFHGDSKLTGAWISPWPGTWIWSGGERGLGWLVGWDPSVRIPDTR